jgi:hypothetical protein
MRARVGGGHHHGRPVTGPSAARGRTEGAGAAGFTRSSVVLLLGLLVFAAASAVVILAR